MSETKREWDTMNIATLSYVYIVEIKTHDKYKSYYSHKQNNLAHPDKRMRFPATQVFYCSPWPGLDLPSFPQHLRQTDLSLNGA